MHVASEIAQNGQNEERDPADNAGAQPSRASDSSSDTSASDARAPDTPAVASPPTSPWWTAPAGKPVDIPDFGHVLFDALAAIFAPAPQPIPLRIRIKR